MATPSWRIKQDLSIVSLTLFRPGDFRYIGEYQISSYDHQTWRLFLKNNINFQNRTEYRGNNRIKNFNGKLYIVSEIVTHFLPEFVQSFKELQFHVYSTAVVTVSDIVLNVNAHVVNANSGKVYSLKIWQLSHLNTLWEKRVKCYKIMLRFNSHNKFPFTYERISYFLIYYLF